MIPHDIDGPRFEYLINHGIPRRRLREFFEDQKRSLMMAGERVQNLPSDLCGAVKRFSPAAHAILRQWLLKELHVPSLDSGQIIARYRAAEEIGVRFEPEERAALDRSALLLLYADPPPDELLEFLRTPVPDPARIRRPIYSPSTDDWLAFLADRSAASGSAQHPLLHAAARLLRAVESWDRSILSDMDESLVEAFDRELNERNAEQRDEVSKTQQSPGIQVFEIPIRSYDDNADYTAYTVIATRVSTRSTDHVPWFATVEAFVDENSMFTLERHDVRRAVPTEGEIVIHKDRGLPIPPLGEPRPYKVERMQNDYRAKVRAIAVVPGLIPFVPLAFTSSDAQLIRKYISDYATRSPVDHALFVTADHLCLAAQGGSLSRVIRPEYDWRLDCWSFLRGYELSNGTYFFGSLPPAESVFDCAPLPTVARRLMKTASARAELALTRAQRDILIEILGDSTFQSSPLTRRRLLDNLSSLDRSHDDYRELVDALLQVADIKKDVEDRVQRAIAERLAEKTSEVAKLENLKRERQALEAAIKRLETERDEKSRTVRAGIRKAFMAATKREVETLGELSLLSAVLTAADSNGTDHEALRSIQPSPQLSARLAPHSNEPMHDVLAAFGLQNTAAETTAEALTLAARSGVAILVQGVGAAEIGTRVAAALSRTSVRSVDICVGLIVQALPDEWLCPSDCDVLLVRYANLSEVALYGPALLTLITQRAMSVVGIPPIPRLILTAAPGSAALPWPDEISTLALKLDIADTQELSVISTTHANTAQHPLLRLLSQKVERIAANDDLSKTVVAQLVHMITKEVARE